LRLTSLLMIPGSETSIPIVGHHELMVGGGSRDPPVVLNDCAKLPKIGVELRGAPGPGGNDRPVPPTDPLLQGDIGGGNATGTSS